MDIDLEACNGYPLSGAAPERREQYVFTLFRMTIKSDHNSARTLMEAALHYFETIRGRGCASGVDGDSFKLCLDEMTENAIQHGSRCKSDKNIHIIIYPDPEGLTIAVKDEGCGFDHSTLENPLEDRNRFRKNGRGIHIMKHLGTVSWNKTGNCVIVRL